MNWLAIINEAFDVCWLLAMLWLLWSIWRSSEKRAEQTVTMETTMIEVARQDAESARQAVETARLLAAVLQNEQARTNEK